MSEPILGTDFENEYDHFLFLVSIAQVKMGSIFRLNKYRNIHLAMKDCPVRAIVYIQYSREKVSLLFNLPTTPSQLNIHVVVIYICKNGCARHVESSSYFLHLNRQTSAFYCLFEIKCEHEFISHLL